ncbi:MAG TPA: efflux transporter outer membrane subunit [candidate division Zixibacteria bacterium]|nr:efflux transporter outer membrane subunit [candidate division Zixibacteria bacterium]
MIAKKVVSALTIVAAMFAAGCAVGPRYARPSAPTPTAWKSQAPWEQAAPKDSLSKGPWWEVFGDPQLNEYEKQMLAANQSLVAARDRLDQARSLARIATAGLFPQVSTDPGVLRERVPGNRVSPTLPTSSYTASQYTVPFALNYEVDLFGRVRKNVQAANQNLQANAADLENVQLVLASELAADYFTLHELDAEYLVVQENVGYQRKGLDLVNRRHQGGVASGLEVAQQAALLDATLTQLALIQQSRAQYEHAIAVLVGQPASSFSIAEAPLRSTPPVIPLGVPSDVLERRPDVATAERMMAYQNSQVGIARTAFYPHITLAGQGGLQSSSAGDLFTAPSLFWAIGADALQPIFQGGRNRANLAAARSAYDAAVANYRQTVLTSFQQVEDGISSLNALAQAATTQAAAVEEARKQLDFANNRYVGGVTTYLDVITAQSTLLSNERLAAQLLGQQMVTSVYLVKALGGGWDAKLIEKEQVHPNASQAVQQ